LRGAKRRSNLVMGKWSKQRKEGIQKEIASLMLAMTGGKLQHLCALCGFKPKLLVF